ncbi:amine sulfotransferase-like [Haemaphysalis longicornis]
MERRKPKHQVIDGVPRCIRLDPDILRENLKFRARAGDVLESAFPKSGTHWVQFIVQLILKKGEPIPSYKEFADNMRLLEYSRCQDWTPTLPMRTFFSHLPLSTETMTEEAKYVYVARNPWDVCVSFFHMATNLSSYEYQDATFEEFVHAFVDGNFGYGDYFAHVASGYALKDRPNVFFVTYEELQKNKRNVVLRLAYFLGEEYGKDLESKKELLENLLVQSSPESI